jgi:hypothetical protein
MVYGLLLDGTSGPLFVDQYEFPHKMDQGDTFTYGGVIWEVIGFSTSRDAGGPGYEESPYQALVCRTRQVRRSG